MGPSPTKYGLPAIFTTLHRQCQRYAAGTVARKQSDICSRVPSGLLKCSLADVQKGVYLTESVVHFDLGDGGMQLPAHGSGRLQAPEVWRAQHLFDIVVLHRCCKLLHLHDVATLAPCSIEPHLLGHSCKSLWESSVDSTASQKPQKTSAARRAVITLLVMVELTARTKHLLGMFTEASFLQHYFCRFGTAAEL